MSNKYIDWSWLWSCFFDFGCNLFIDIINTTYLEIYKYVNQLDFFLVLIMQSLLSLRLDAITWKLWNIVFLLTIFFFSVVLAVAVPDLELLIGLVGAIFFSTLGLLIPVVVQTVHKWERGLGKYSYILWKNGLLLIFYIIVLVSGCYAAINAIIAKLA